MTAVSKADWTELARQRLAQSQTYAVIVGADWFEGEFLSLQTATAQTSCHPLLQIVCAGDGEALGDADAMFALLRETPGFRERVQTLKSVRDVEQGWAKWNEIRSAALFAGARVQPSFPSEVGAALARAPEFTFTFGGETVAVEVATVSDTPDRKAARNRFQDELRSAAKRLAKKGKGGVVGGMVPQPARFSQTTGRVDPDGDPIRAETPWAAIQYVMNLKRGARQLAAAKHRILHVVSSNAHFMSHDFLPESFTNDHGLRYRHSGRIYNAFYGIAGQRLYSHHFIGHPDSYRDGEGYRQERAGRFVENTSFSACVWTMHRDAHNGAGAVGGSHVLYLPLEGAGESLPRSLVEALDASFVFRRDLSVCAHLREFDGPHAAYRRSRPADEQRADEQTDYSDVAEQDESQAV